MRAFNSWCCLGIGLLFAAGCDEDEGGPEPFADGTCVNDYTGTGFGNENHCVYPGSYTLNHENRGDEWCDEEYQLLYPLRDDGSRVPCEELGYPTKCSNCTGRDFFYESGKVCKDCSQEGGGSSPPGGGDTCDYSGCVEVCIQAGGSNCGQDCACD